ncbi:MAG: M56 family metallopeptidase, partial [Ruminococcaceae bacterium]|nr:M56 family metallopeptidase [Oscillospiraceae bacterium]
ASAQNPALDHVLAHELTHYRHKDHLWAFVRCLCLCLYWFHPLVWLAAFLSRRDCELACDEGALAKLGEDERIAYGKTLLEIVSQAGGHGHLLQTATTMNESKRQLKERVNYIVKQPKVWIAAAIAMVLVCGVCFGCALSGRETTEPTPTDEHLTQTTAPTTPTEATAPNTNEPKTGPMGGVLLSEEEIGQVNRTIMRAECLTNQYFLQPETVNLAKLLKWLSVGIPVSSAELRAIQQEIGLEDEDMPRSGWAKCDRAQVDLVLMRYLGIDSKQLYTVPAYGAVYLEEYDFYYSYLAISGEQSAAFLCHSGEVIGNKAYLYGRDELSGKESVFTMEQKDGQWYLYSHLPANIATVEDSTPLTAEQLHQVNEAFYPIIYVDKDGVEFYYASPMSCFFMSTYRCPEEMDLSRFLRNYPYSVSATEAEWDAANEAYAEIQPGGFYPQCNKLEKKIIDETLLSVMGITSDVLYHGAQGNLVYVEAYDAYFNGTTDFENGTFDCFGGVICGDVAYLYSEDAVLTLVQREGNWYIYAHLTMEDFAAQAQSSQSTPLTEEQLQQVNEAVNAPESLAAYPFFRAYYTHPEGFSLEEYLIYCTEYTIVGGEEQALAVERTGNPFQQTGRRFAKSDIDQELTKWLGITSDTLYHGPTINLVYLEDYQSFYTFTSNKPGRINFTGGEIQGNTLYLYNDAHIVRLEQHNGQWQFVSNMPVNMSVTGEGVLLSGEQLHQVKQAFTSETFSRNEDRISIRATTASCFFTSYYNRPEEINLSDFLRHCPLGVRVTGQERDAAMAATGYGAIEQACTKFEKSQVDELLMSVMGITSDNLAMEGRGIPLVYLEEYDSYYNFISNYGPGFFECFGGEICGDTVYLYSPSAILTLVQREGTWYIYSHVLINPMFAHHS